MNDDEQALQDWLRAGLSTEPADRTGAELGAWEAYGALGELVPKLCIWVPSPMAGVLASTSVGFALGENLKPRLMEPFSGAESQREVNDSVWSARTAIHAQIATELTTRGPRWENWKREMSDYAWNQVWETVGDPIYSQAWEQQAAAADGLFEENLGAWADAMMEGQFNAGMMAGVDALDPLPLNGIRRTARSCGWWWAYSAGAVFCDRPESLSVSGSAVTMTFRDGWTVASS